MTRKWEFLSGEEVEDSYLHQTSLQDLVPSCEAIYLWRRRLSVPRGAIHDGPGFMAWLENAMQAPTGEIRNQHLSHFALLEYLTIRGQKLTPEKRRLLARFAGRPKMRKWLAHYVRSLAQFSPPLYCGETGNLAQRVRDHVSAETGFGQQVQHRRVPPWCELELAFYALGDADNDDDLKAKERRTLLEIVTTAFSVAGYVVRRG